VRLKNSHPKEKKKPPHHPGRQNRGQISVAERFVGMIASAERSVEGFPGSNVEKSLREKKERLDKGDHPRDCVGFVPGKGAIAADSQSK